MTNLGLISLENLLALFFQAGGSFTVRDQTLRVLPVNLAEKYQDDIRRLKPRILESLGCCPTCATPLIETEGNLLPSGEKRKHVYCPVGNHYDNWPAGMFKPKA